LHNGYGVIMGGITGVPPTKVVILGAGVVGEFACRAALGLGAEVKVFDFNIYKLMRLQNNIGRRIFTSVLDPNIIKSELATADVAIGAIHAEEGRAPVVVPENMVEGMLPGSVIIDVSIDQGGCFETSEITTHKQPVFTKHVLKISNFNSLDRLIWNNEGIRHGVYLYKGSLTNKHLGEKFNIKTTDLDLLMAANI